MKTHGESFLWPDSQVFDQAVANILRQRKHSLSPRFRGANEQFAARPIDVFQGNPRNFFGTKA